VWGSVQGTFSDTLVLNHDPGASGAVIRGDMKVNSPILDPIKSYRTNSCTVNRIKKGSSYYTSLIFIKELISLPRLARRGVLWCRPRNYTSAPTPNRTCKFPSIRLSR